LVIFWDWVGEIINNNKKMAEYKCDNCKKIVSEAYVDIDSGEYLCADCYFRDDVDEFDDFDD
jgi:formylmethanofuran dehydrogenase subunit E